MHIDALVARQLDEILHHPRFQRLEASWRGLQYLVATEAECDQTLNIKVRVLNVAWVELSRDLTRALEFDQSNIFRRIYSDEFDTPGGQPYGLVLGDYEVSHRPRPGAAAEDAEVLSEMARVAMAALCPFVTGAASALFGLDSFAELKQPVNLDTLFQQREYGAWNRLRRDEHARFLGIALPRVLMREPYRADGTRREPFQYEETVWHDREAYLWGNPCYAFGAVVIRAFASTGWFADIRGGEHSFGEGGVARNLTYSAFDLDRQRVAPRAATETEVDDFSERTFADHGFIPLCGRHGASYTAFFSNSSLHIPPDQRSEITALNAKLSAMLQYMLCVSRFGHYIKLMVRDKVGSFANATECQQMLQDWLHDYTTAAEGASAELKARYPLARSRVEVREIPGRPGHFNCVVHLQPHFQLDQLVTAIRLVTELAVGPTGGGT